MKLQILGTEQSKEAPRASTEKGADGPAPLAPFRRLSPDLPGASGKDVMRLGRKAEFSSWLSSFQS